MSEIAVAVARLADAGVESPRADAELMAAHRHGVSRSELNLVSDADFDPRFWDDIARREAREPLQHITGVAFFRYLELEVGPGVFVPRPETEVMTGWAIDRLTEMDVAEPVVVDLGTGSGAIALAIAEELPGCEVVATDTSAAALAVARVNAERLGLAGRVEFIEGMLPGDETGWVGEGGAQAIDLVVANLPYVAESEWADLEPEVIEWEPREALLAGPDGLDVLRAAIPAFAGVAPVVALEVGTGQAAAVADLLFDAGFGQVETRPDLAGIPRVVIGRPRSGDFAFSDAIAYQTTKSAEDE